jgi:hypothetical protein
MYMPTGKLSVYDDNIMYCVDGAEHGSPLPTSADGIVWQRVVQKGGISRLTELIIEHYSEGLTDTSYAKTKLSSAEDTATARISALRMGIVRSLKKSNGLPFRAASIPHVLFCICSSDGTSV